jgi:hypothetical protein
MYTSTEISGSAAAVGYSSGTAIKVIQEVAAEKTTKDMILTGQVYADEVSQGNQAIWVFLICLGFVFGFSSTIRKFYSALIRNSIITSGYIWCFPFAEVDRFRK